MSFVDYFTSASVLSIILPAIISLFKLKSLNASLRLLSVYLISTSIKEGVCTYLASYHQNNIPIYNIVGIFDNVVLLLIFYYSGVNQKYKKVILGFIVILSIFSIINISSIQGINNLNTYSRLVRAIFIVIITLSYFYELLKGADNQNLIKLPLFWVSTGLLFFSTGTFFLYSLYTFYTNLNPETGKILWLINSLLYLVQNVLFTIALFCNRRRTI